MIRAHWSTVILFVCALLTVPAAGLGQWLKYPTPGIPRTSAGKPDLSAPAPRTREGTPDLSGLWEAGTKFESDFKPLDAQPWAQEQAKRHEANLGTDSWAALCLPPGPMINFAGPFRIVQTPGIVAVLYEMPNNYRQIFTDGRELPKDPNPTWQGYSVGHWDGDTLVVETIGFNDKSMIGRQAHPHTEALRLTERYRRRDFGHVELQMTVDDPKTFSRPWKINAELDFQPDTEMLEYVCNENEKDRQHFVVTPSTGTSESHVDVAVLAKYAGAYEVTDLRGRVEMVTIALEGDQLLVSRPGRPPTSMVPQSATMFLAFGATVEFVTNEQGVVTHLLVHIAEGDMKGVRTDPAR